MSEREYNRFFGVLRLVAVFGVVVALVYFGRPTLLSVAVGFAFVALGESVRFWSSGLLLKTTGVIIMVNLPNYLSLIGLVVGWGWFLGVYMRRKERVEPARLREEHGEAYDRYFEAVPGLFPTLRPYKDYTPAKWSADRMIRNKEYAMVIGLAGITAFLLWRALTS